MLKKSLLPLLVTTVLIFVVASRSAIVHASTPSSCYPALSFATTAIPSATAGSTYSATLAATGGQPPYQWSFGQSSLPSGFSINSNGDLTGTPTVAGNYIFNVVVSDSLKNNVTGALSLTVLAVTPPPTQPTPPPTQPTPPPIGPVGPATGTALTQCGDITKSGTYYLANDVSSAGTCFGIDANNITLNLNGHTITYGTGGGNTATPAIEGHDPSWTAANSPNYTGNSYSGSAHGGAEIYGGNIVQSTSAAPFSPVFAFGQGNFSSAPYIHDISATFQNQGAIFYYSQYLPANARIVNNVIYDNVTNIQRPGQGMLSARSAFQGQTIGIFGQENNPVTSGDTITGNRIIGGPQGGIRTVNQYSTISTNDIAMNSLYTNDWCVDISADHQTVTNNNCHPTSGRGINVDGNYVTVTGNTLTVTELKQNSEYGTANPDGTVSPGCEIQGAYGIRVEHMPLGSAQPGATTDDNISGNTVTVNATVCNAFGFDIIYMPANASGINITNNIITTTNVSQSGVLDAGFQFDDSYGNGVSITDNTITSVNQWLYGWWDGFNNITVGHNTWKGNPPLTVLTGDGGCAPGVSDPGSVCPVSITVMDALPNNVSCGQFSVATVTVNGQVTQCKPQQ